jgi:hypothetical protein
MARIWICVVEIGERRIGNTGTQRHVWTPAVVVGNPRFQDAPEMTFRQGNQPLQTLATNCVASRPTLRAPGQILVDRSGRHTSPDLQRQFIGDALLAPRKVLIGDPANQCA